MVNNKKKTVEELAKEMDTACALSSEISEEELIEYDAEYGYDYYEEDSFKERRDHRNHSVISFEKSIRSRIHNVSSTSFMQRKIQFL